MLRRQTGLKMEKKKREKEFCLQCLPLFVLKHLGYKMFQEKLILIQSYTGAIKAYVALCNFCDVSKKPQKTTYIIAF